MTQLKGCPFPGKGSFKGNETGYGTRDAGVPLTSPGCVRSRGPHLRELISTRAESLVAICLSERNDNDIDYL